MANTEEKHQFPPVKNLGDAIRVESVAGWRLERRSGVFRLPLRSESIAIHFDTIPVIIISKIIVEGVCLARRDCE